MTASVEDGLGTVEYIANPYPTYALLRDEHPLYWSEKWSVWIVSRYEDVQRILGDFDAFSNAGRFGAISQSLSPNERLQLQPVINHNSVGMLQADPPDHTRLRSLVRKVFSPRVIKNITPLVHSVVGEVLEKASREGGLEVVTDLAFRVPIAVICELLGVPRSDADLFMKWADAISSFQATGAPDPVNSQRAAIAVVEIENYFDEVCTSRRSQPGDDLISIMIRARDGDSSLTHAELINMSVNLLFAGHETTKSLIANATLALMNHDSQRLRLVEDPSMISIAIEESLRFDSPVQRGWRRVSRPQELYGQHLRVDDVIFMMIGAANRDPRVFDDPDDFDITRQPNRHIAFGYGIHHCIGAPLARIEGPVAVGALFRQFPHMRVTQSVTWINSIHVRSPQSLQLEIVS